MKLLLFNDDAAAAVMMMMIMMLNAACYMKKSVECTLVATSSSDMHVELNLIEIDVALLLNTIKGEIILETQLRTLNKI